MSMKFSDGWEVDTSGEYRVVKGPDGWYVVGHNMLIPVDSYEDGLETIKVMQTQDKRAKGSSRHS